jgi:hypothetical protein
MEIKDVVEGWCRHELTGDAVMILIWNILYPSVITQEDIDWTLEDEQLERASRNQKE